MNKCDYRPLGSLSIYINKRNSIFFVSADKTDSKSDRSHLVEAETAALYVCKKRKKRGSVMPDLN